MNIIPQERLLDLFSYSDGVLYNTINRGSLKAGDPIGYPDRDGYTRAKVDGKECRLNRLIFCYHHGYYPEVVDHIDGDKTNDRIENLRGCDRAQNLHNRIATSGSRSRYKGVDFNVNKWRARICCRGTRVDIGRYDSEIEAAKAYDEKARELHGEYAKTNFVVT